MKLDRQYAIVLSALRRLDRARVEPSDLAYRGLCELLYAQTNGGAEMPKTLAQYLQRRSREICADNQCMDDDHKCESYAYITADYRLIAICIPDYFQEYAKPYAAIALPWTGNQHQLEQAVAAQCEELQLDMEE